MIPLHIAQIACDEVEFDEVESGSRITHFVTEVLAPLIPAGISVISVDGFDGTGKSTTAKHLAAQRGVPLVGLDDHLIKGQGRFLGALRLNDIMRSFDAALKESKGVVIEGCAVAAVLKQLGRKPDFRIYQMRTSRMRSGVDNEWVREDDVLYGEKSTEQILAEMNEVAVKWAEMAGDFSDDGSGRVPGIEEELVRYHREFRPHDRADLIVKLVHWS